VRIGLIGGLRLEHDGQPIVVTGTMQLAVLFRLAVDAGSAVSYRSIAEDIWSLDAPENTRAALQSIVSRLRTQLPDGLIESTAGGYRLAIARTDVDALVFEDLVAAANSATDPSTKSRLAADALALWTGEPWTPSADFDWFERDLHRDHAAAVALAASIVEPPTSSFPVPLTTLIGRGSELAAIAAQLASSRLVTIIGPGGVGKTRLAIAAGGGIRGALLVELAPAGPSEVLGAILAATGRELRTIEATTTDLTSALERVIEAFIGRPVLLVLDNCEHVIDEAARIAETLLGALPQLTILATSREPLAIAGEAFVPVGPLGLPPSIHNDAMADAVGLLDFSAVELFQQRATAATGAPLGDDDLRIAATICRRLDGLPLALELAAARLRTMTVAEVLDGLEHRFALLTGGFRTALPRHRTLKAMIDWSWSLLSADERLALTRLAVYPAGIAVTDAERIADSMGLDSPTAFELLVDRSLLQRTRGRYRALETIREYGIERLVESDSLVLARRSQAEYMAARAAEADARLRGPGMRAAIAWFDAEEDNIAAALRFSTQSELAETAVTLVISCGWYWVIRDRNEDSGLWYTAVEPLAATLDSPEARVVGIVAPLVRSFGAFDDNASPDAVFANISDALPSAEHFVTKPGDHDLVQALPVLIRAFAATGSPGNSSSPGNSGSPGSPGSDGGWMLNVRIPDSALDGLDPWPTGLIHIASAALANNRGDIATLGDASRRAVELFSAVGDPWGLAFAEQIRAQWLTIVGRLEEAFALTEKSTANMRSIASSWDLAQQQELAISILIRQERVEEAADRAGAILAEAEETGNVRAVLQAVMSLLNVDVARRDIRSARAHFERFDLLAESWPGMPVQMFAWVECARASIALYAGDTDAAEEALRIASAHALTTGDHPVMATVALGLGSLALERGDIAEAVRALDLASAIAGAVDSTSPQVRAIERAAAAAGYERAAPEATTRQNAVEQLRTLAG
jgi:predicted ATPase